MFLKPPKGAMLNRGHNLSRGLILGYIFNEGGGNKVYDISGHGNHGTHISPTAHSGGIGGPCVDYLALVNGAKTTLTSEITVTSNMTVVIRMYCTSALGGSNLKMFAGKNDADNYWAISGRDDMRIQDNTSVNREFTLGFTYPAWHTFALTNDGSDWRIYVDGKYGDIETTGGQTLQIDMVGNGYNASTYDYDSKIDYVYIYDRLLTPSELMLVYREPFQMFWVDM